VTPAELRTIRERLRLHQWEAAELVGVTENTWARWERGELGVHPARVRDLDRLAEKAARKRP
jgi:DNA-binding transcriptional regulator YiaG